MPRGVSNPQDDQVRVAIPRRVKDSLDRVTIFNDGLGPTPSSRFRRQHFVQQVHGVSYGKFGLRGLFCACDPANDVKQDESSL